MMKISYTTLSVSDRTVEEAVNLASRWGLDGIELRGKSGCHAGIADSFLRLFQIRRTIQKARLVIPCLTAYTRFYQPDRVGMLSQVEELVQMAELARFLGAGTVRTFMGPLPENLERKQAVALAREGLFLAAERMGDSPVSVIIETHDSVKSGKVLAELLDGLPKRIGVLLDIIHPWDAGESIEETWNWIGDRIYHVHIKDIARNVPGGRVYCPIGSGILPVRETVAYLKKKGYDSFFSLEWEPSAGGYEGISLEQQMESFLAFRNEMEETT